MSITGVDVTSQNAADISIYFDVGGIIGAILAGLAADFTGMSASVCSIMLITSIPMVISKIVYKYSPHTIMLLCRCVNMVIKFIFLYSFLDTNNTIKSVHLILHLQRAMVEISFC